ncbi:MAG: hypothetical protein PHD02_03195 [Bacilli bacterium]|nr:hypothetical protein [Bacilli bacterium]
MKKNVKKILIAIIIIILILAILGTVDYIRANNKQKPIFTYKEEIINSDNMYVGTKYYGAGYTILILDYCGNYESKIFPLGIGTFAWFINGSCSNQ